MKPLQPAKLAPVVVNPNAWTKMEDGSFRSGNVLIRCDERESFGGYTFERWNIYRVEENGTLTRIWCKSRPWSYGRSGQAKIGASRIMKPLEEETDGTGRQPC